MLPTFVSNEEGMSFVRQKRDWIVTTLSKHQQHLDEIVPKTYAEGESFSYLGQDYPLRIYIGNSAAVQCVNGLLYVGLTQRQCRNKADSIRKNLWKWYQQQALELLTRKTDQYVQAVGLRYESVQLRRTKTKWGHCTADGVLQFNWLVVAAPESVIDYLVAHEVSHLRHPNHSKRFWRHVEKLCPDYRAQRRWLHDKGHTLTI